MPAPSAQQIILLRLKVRVVLRVLAVVLLLVALGWASMRYSDYSYAQSLFAAGMGRPLGPLHHSFFGIPILLGGMSIACVLLGQFALPLLVPVPKPACPRCGYDLANPTSNTCPECGLRIADQPANHPS
ncbi:MAG: hypothetical protein ACFCBV_10015 [Phycisphaerales bacterium]